MGQAIRWQAIIAFLGILLLAAILGSQAVELAGETIVPSQGGVYTEATVGTPQFINPLLAFGADLDRELSSLIFDGLVRVDERGEVKPDLASSWEISPDGLTYTFTLRPDIRWHDGAPFTADDVVYTVQVLQSETFASPDSLAPKFLSDFWRTVTVTKLDNTTVQFQLQEPYAPFLYEATIGILPAHLWREVPIADMGRSLLNLQPVGTGPWRLVDLTATGALLEPSPYYGGPDPYLDALELRFYPDYASAFAAFQAGEVDGVSRILPENLALAQESEQMKVLSAPLAGETLLYFNLSNPNAPFLADKQVRQALWLALDHQAVIDAALGGQGVPADGLFMPGTWANAAPAHPGPDVEKAAELLTAAGWVDSEGDGDPIRDKDGQSLSFVLLGDNEKLLTAIAEQWAQIGVYAKPQVVGLVSLAGDYLSPRNYEAALVHWQLGGDPDPYPLWHSTQSESGQNYTGWSHNRADEIMEEARAVSDPGRRFQLYEEFQQIFADELPALPIYFDVYSFGVHDNVKAAQVGRLHTPADRFNTLPTWYVATERVVEEPTPGMTPGTP